jgi:hypothetical protein
VLTIFWWKNVFFQNKWLLSDVLLAIQNARQQERRQRAIKEEVCENIRHFGGEIRFSAIVCTISLIILNK